MRLCAFVLLFALVLGACDDDPSTVSSGKPDTSLARTTTTERPSVLLAAGDIATCAGKEDEATAMLLDELIEADPQARIAALGDLAYEKGTASEFKECYGPTWGKFHARTRPTPGNHEYGTGNADAYFEEWGSAAGEKDKGWYSYDIGAWHAVVLNSNCKVASVGGCGPDSEQGRWLASDLAAHPTKCALAYWHHPRFSSGLHGSTEMVQPLWETAAAAGVDVVLNGHDHHYERFKLIDGMREFVVGTGGAPRYPLKEPVEGSEVRHTGTPGVLELTLQPDRYDWRFRPVGETSFADAGSATCH